MVIEPVSFDDAQQVADHIRNHKPVVVNFENTSSDMLNALLILSVVLLTLYPAISKKVGKKCIYVCPK